MLAELYTDMDRTEFVHVTILVPEVQQSIVIMPEGELQRVDTERLKVCFPGAPNGARLAWVYNHKLEDWEITWFHSFGLYDGSSVGIVEYPSGQTNMVPVPYICFGNKPGGQEC